MSTRIKLACSPRSTGDLLTLTNTASLPSGRQFGDASQPPRSTTVSLWVAPFCKSVNHSEYCDGLDLGAITKTTDLLSGLIAPEPSRPSIDVTRRNWRDASKYS